jgi:hypothetical protein
MVMVYFLQRIRAGSFTTMKTLWRGFLIGTDLLLSVMSFYPAMNIVERKR